VQTLSDVAAWANELAKAAAAAVNDSGATAWTAAAHRVETFFFNRSRVWLWYHFLANNEHETRFLHEKFLREKTTSANRRYSL